MDLREQAALDESAQGYRDGREVNAIPPGPNRSRFYAHGFTIGQAEIAGNPIPAQISRERWTAMLTTFASENNVEVA